MPPIDAIRFEQLTPREIVEETSRLFALRYDGDDPARLAAWDEARGRIVVINRPLVIRFVQARVRHLGDREDSIQDGLIGLDEAARRFDPGKGVRFSTFAVYWIRNAVLAATCDTGTTIRVPRYIRDALRGYIPVQAGSLTERRVAQGQRALEGWIPSGDAFGAVTGLIQGEGDPRCPDPSDAIESRERLAALAQALAGRLDDREREVISRRFGLEGPAMTQREIGAIFGVTYGRIQQIERDALAKLRRSLAGDADHARGPDSAARANSRRAAS